MHAAMVVGLPISRRTGNRTAGRYRPELADGRTVAAPGRSARTVAALRPNAWQAFARNVADSSRVIPLGPEHAMGPERPWGQNAPRGQKDESAPWGQKSGFTWHDYQNAGRAPGIRIEKRSLRQAGDCSLRVGSPINSSAATERWMTHSENPRHASTGAFPVTSETGIQWSGVLWSAGADR
jgi:hypothetical protein